MQTPSRCHPLTAHEVKPATTVAALVRADERLQEEFPKITLPVLIMHGTEDKATVCHAASSSIRPPDRRIRR